MCVIEIGPVIETRRLTLRSPTRADASRIVALADNWNIARMLSRMPHPYRPEHADRFLEACEAHDPAREQVFAIDLEDEGLVGVIGLDPHEEGTELGYWLGQPYWGRGLVSEAVDAVLAWARKSWRRRHIVAGHYSDNPASGRVLCKAGFLYTGRIELRDSQARGEPAPTRMMVWLA